MKSGGVGHRVTLWVVMDESALSASQYNTMAAAYAADNAESAFNAYYERPATISLIGDVKGQRVLEAGCGSGVLTTWLVEHGAVVTAFDISEEMAALARRAVGDRAGILVADLSKPLAFASDQSFDRVVASLVMHYVEDWLLVFKEFHRVLSPTGVVVFSTHHPTMDWKFIPGHYFETRQITETWRKGATDFEVTFWRRPLTAMTDAIASAGFTIERLVEPPPLPELLDRDPVAFASLSSKPRFLFFVLKAQQ